jgi:uncharacterized membrane protein
VQTISGFFIKSVATILVLTVTILSSETFAQSNLRIFDVPGGSGSGTTQTDDSNDNSTIYIVGGLVIAGILAYALFFKEKKAETDTTASLSSPSIYSNISEFDSAEEEFQKVKEQIPVDIFMGIKNDEAVLNNRMYQLGVRVKF